MDVKDVKDLKMRIVRLTIDNDELMSAIHSRGHKALADVMTTHRDKWIGSTENVGTFDWPVAEEIIATCGAAGVDIQIEDVEKHDAIIWL